MNSDPQGRPSEAWRLHPPSRVGTRNRAALLWVGHQRTVASVPDPAAGYPSARMGVARPLWGPPGGGALCGEYLGQDTSGEASGATWTRKSKAKVGSNLTAG